MDIMELKLMILVKVILVISAFALPITARISSKIDANFDRIEGIKEIHELDSLNNELECRLNEAKIALINNRK
jgi:hypothetical protein